jgi:hypothetical protein
MVLANTVLFAPSVLLWRLMFDESVTGLFRVITGRIVEYTLVAYGFLFLLSLLILIAQRRQDHSWSFSLSAVFCGLMFCVGMCADLVSH